MLATQAGHDAGILSAAGIPTAMLFVRNPTGVSHSPAEHAEVADCLAGVEAPVELAAFGDTEAQLAAVAGALVGEVEPGGTLPVSLGGRPVGDPCP